jgi:hypothetical protein
VYRFPRKYFVVCGAATVGVSILFFSISLFFATVDGVVYSVVLFLFGLLVALARGEVILSRTFLQRHYRVFGFGLFIKRSELGHVVKLETIERELVRVVLDDADSWNIEGFNSVDECEQFIAEINHEIGQRLRKP